MSLAEANFMGRKPGELRTRWALVSVLAVAMLVTLVPMPGFVLAHDILRTAFLLIAASTLVTMPGLALVLLLRPFDDLDMLETLCLGAMTSLALFPVLLFWVGLVGAQWSAFSVRGALLVAAGLVVWRLGFSRGAWPTLGKPVSGPALMLGLIMALTLASRLYVIQGIPYPPGADSYHHTIITQIILDTGRVPANYYPFAKLDSFSYHFGFHAYSAALAWITGLPAHRAVFWGAQYLSALSVPSVYLLVSRLARDRRAALIAAVVAGLTCHMPAYYMIWGRDTQLMGQVVLGAAIAATVDVACQARFRWQAILCGALLLAGLTLSHYRVAMFYIAFLPILGLALSIWQHRNLRGLARVALGLLCMGSLTVLLIAPWIPIMLERLPALTPATATSDLTIPVGYALTLDQVATWGLKPALLCLTVMAGLWALFVLRRKPLGAGVLLWAAFLLGLATPGISPIPWSYITYNVVIIALYLPAAVIIGLAVSDLVPAPLSGLAQGDMPVALRIRPVRRVEPLLIVGVLLAALGLQVTLDLPSLPRHELVRNSDVQAMEWVRAHTPPDAVFAVDPLFYRPGALAGYDAGFWLPYIARRSTFLPPMTYFVEADASYVSEVNGALLSLTNTRSAQELAALLKQLGAGYVYIGHQNLRPWTALLQDESYFEALYALDDIRVFRLR
jgi:hypothetical protein